MIKLSDILTIVGDVKEPVVSNDGYSLNLFSPTDLYLNPGAVISLPSGLILNLPEPIIGLMNNKFKNKIEFSFRKGQIIYPSYDKEFIYDLKYEGLSPERIKKGDPLCQITLINAFKMQ